MILEILYLVTITAILLLLPVMAVYVWTQRHSPGAKPLLGALLCGVEVVLSIWVLTLTPTESTAFVWARMRFLGLAFLAPALLLFVYEFQGRPLQKAVVWLLFVIPAATQVIIWTKGTQPGWFYAEWNLHPYELISVEHVRYTGWMLIHTLYGTLLALWLTGVLFKGVWSSVGFERWRYGLLTFASLVSLTLVTVNPVLAARGIPNMTPLGFAFFAMILIYTFSRYNLLTVTPVALSSVFEDIPDLVIIQDQKGRVVLINPAAQKQIGKPETQIIGRPLSEILGQNLLDSLEAQPFRRKVRLWQRNYDAQLSPLTQANMAVGSMLIMRDVTTLEQLDLDLHLREQAINASPVGVFIVDCQKPEKNLLYINDTFTRMTGYTPDEVLGKSYKVFQSSEQLREELSAIQAAMLESKPVQASFINQRKDGSTFWCELRFAPVFHNEVLTHYLGVMLDISERKQAEDALTASEAHLKSILASMDDLIFVIDEHGKFVSFHQPHTATSLYAPPEVFIGKPFHEVLPSFLSEKIQSSIEVLRETDAVQQFDYLLPIGERTEWFNAKISRHQVAQGACSGVMAVVRNITERKRAEQQTQNFLDALKALQQISLELVEIDDLEALYLRIIELGRQRLGFDRIGLFLMDRLTQELVGTFGVDPAGHIRDERNYREPITADHWTHEILENANHMRFWANAKQFDYGAAVSTGWKAASALWNGAMAIGFIVIDNASTKVPARFYEAELISLYSSTIGHLIELKRTENSLRQREAHYRILARNLPDTSVFLFDRDKRLLITEGQFLKQAGYEPAQLEGKLLHEAIPDRVNQVLPLYESALRGERHNLEVERPEFTFYAQSVPIEDEHGEVVGGLIVSRNVTRQKQFERELRAAKEAAEAANFAKSRFLASISHELRTPLNAILGFAELLSHDEKLPQKQRDQLQIIAQNGEHLLDLINDVLEISKIEAGKSVLNPRPFDLWAMLQAVYSLLAPRAGAKRLEFYWRIAEDVPQYLVGDETKLRQIFMNLLSNAFKFTESPGSVTVDVQYRNAPVSGLIITIQDTGIGISEEEQPTLFQPFTQTRSGIEVQQGTGLGLAITRQYVQLMRGEITVESVVGQGTTFTVMVQVDLADGIGEESTSAKKVVGLLTPPPEPYRILVADDAPANALLIQMMLEQFGFEVQAASTGESAVAIALAWQPHLIFMDLYMPNMDGFEATVRIHQQLPDLPIIALTANIFEQPEELIRRGFELYLRKPVTQHQIYNCLQNCLGLQWQYELSEREQSSNKNIENALAALPSALRQDLQQAALKADLKACRASIAEIAKHAPELAEMLSAYVDSFQIDVIHDLLQAR